MPIVDRSECTAFIGPLLDLASVVAARLDDDDAVSVDLVDQPMLVRDPTRPGTGQVLTEGLRPFDADSRLAKRLADQRNMQPLGCLNLDRLDEAP